MGSTFNVRVGLGRADQLSTLKACPAKRQDLTVGKWLTVRRLVEVSSISVAQRLVSADGHVGPPKATPQSGHEERDANVTTPNTAGPAYVAREGRTSHVERVKRKDRSG